MVSKYIKNLKSHPDKTLIDHILGVKDRGLILLNDYRVRNSALFHDIGKMTKNFQDKLDGRDVTGLYTNHAYLSFYALLNYVAQYRCRPGLVANKEDLIVMGASILKHHGGLPNLFEIINVEEWERMEAFLLTHPYMPVDELLSAMGLDRDAVHFSLRDIPLENIIAGTRALYSPLGLRGTIRDPLRFFFDLKMNFSALVAADKGDAGRHKITTEATHRIAEVYGTRINSYLDGFTTRQATEMNTIRTEIRQDCVANLRQAMTAHPDQHVFSLTEPTGSGKTAILLTLANEVMQRKRVSKVVYSIPFLSITEQVYGIIERIFNEEQGCLKRIDCKAQPEMDASEIHDDYGEENLLKKLRSMMRKIFKGKTVREEAVEELLKKDYQESTFDYPLIVTTFVQFFQSFTTSTNKGLMRLTSLQNSVFLIDEIQAMPSRLYSFFVALLDEFCRRYNSYAIISTATMPSFEIPSNAVEARALFRNYRQPVEIGNFNHFTHEVFNRYELHIDKSRTDVDSLVSRILRETEPTLVICNTIKDSLRIYDAIKASANAPVVKLMNSNFHSKDRKTILNRCQTMLNESRTSGTRFFFVTTQLIEAGVDIDFPVVYRDIAPLPNLIQTAGRCNREGLLRNPDGSRRRGIVTIFLLKEDEKNMLRAQHIYNGLDAPFLDYAIRVLVLVPQPIFEERELFNLQRGYFTYMAQRLQFGAWEKGTEHCDFIQQIRDFKFREIGAYTVIPAKQYGVQERFYVPENENDDAYERLLELLAEKENLDQLGSRGNDTLREIIFRGTQVHGHLKGMMDRVVQVNIAETDLRDLVVYENQCCYMYKLKPGFYTMGPEGHSEYGLRV